ncbi:MAG: hypothetical protein WCN95_09730 [bacterium]
MAANSKEDVTVKHEAPKQEPAVSASIIEKGLAHDLRNVLCPIIMLCDKVTKYIELHGDPVDPDRTDALDEMQTIKESATEAACMVRQFAVSGNYGKIQKSAEPHINNPGH